MPLVSDAAPAGAPRMPLVIGHRGASGLAPENTIAAFKLACAMGASGVEMDVQLTADHYAVVIHDSKINRTTNGAGPVSHLTLKQLQNLDAGSWFERRLFRWPRGRAIVRNVSAEADDVSLSLSSQKVPTLEAVLSIAAEAGLERIYIELKGGDATSQALLETVLSLVRTLGVTRSVTLLSFDHAIVSSAKKIAGDIRTAATFNLGCRTIFSTEYILRAAMNAGVDEVALQFGLATRRAVETFHEHGLSVSVWTANSKLAMRRLVACDVDAIMTNFPNRLLEVLDSTPQRSLLA